MRRQLAQLVNNSLLCVWWNRSFGFLHRKDNVLLVFGNLRQHCQNEHVDRASPLPIVRRSMTSFARRYEGRDDIAQMISGKSGNSEMGLDTPFLGNVFVQRGVDAF